MPNIDVSGIVSQRNKEPYVQLRMDEKAIAQLTMSEARKIANDLYLAASRAEADAMLLRFFETRDLPAAAGAMLMKEFRDFRLGLDLDKAQGFYSEPDDGAQLAPCPDCGHAMHAHIHPERGPYSQCQILTRTPEGICGCKRFAPGQVAP